MNKLYILKLTFGMLGNGSYIENTIFIKHVNLKNTYI